MRIIGYKPTVTIVASAEEWGAFDYNLPSEIGSQIRRKVQRTRKAERHSIAITFDYRIRDVLRAAGRANTNGRVDVENCVRDPFVVTLVAEGESR